MGILPYVALRYDTCEARSTKMMRYSSAGQRAPAFPQCHVAVGIVEKSCVFSEKICRYITLRYVTLRAKGAHARSLISLLVYRLFDRFVGGGNIYIKNTFNQERCNQLHRRTTHGVQLNQAGCNELYRQRIHGVQLATHGIAQTTHTAYGTATLQTVKNKQLQQTVVQQYAHPYTNGSTVQ